MGEAMAGLAGGPGAPGFQLWLGDPGVELNGVHSLRAVATWKIGRHSLG